MTLRLSTWSLSHVGLTPTEEPFSETDIGEDRDAEAAAGIQQLSRTNIRHKRTGASVSTVYYSTNVEIGGPIWKTYLELGGSMEHPIDPILLTAARVIVLCTER